MNRQHLLIGLLMAVPNVHAGMVINEASITMEAANTIANQAIKDCQSRGFPAVVTVVDHRAQLKVALVSDGAFPHAVETSLRKAKTAASRREASGEVVSDNAHEQHLSGAFHAIGLTSLGGGLPIVEQGRVIGGLGIAGAPGEDELGRDYDLMCAEAGLKAVNLKRVDRLDMEEQDG